MMMTRFILIILLTVPGISHAAGAIFYQPQLRDMSIEADRWPVIFKAVRDRGIETVIVQWTSYGEVFDSIKSRTWLKNRLEDAISAGMNLIIGLNADPEVFIRLEQPAGVLSDYFRKQRRLDTDLAKYWLDVLSGQKISGWYITMEIDDRRWRDSSSLNVLAAHLAFESEALRAVGDKPVYISSFFAGNTSPTRYTDMLLQIKKDSKIKILVQDGAGTGKLSERERTLYLDNLSDCRAPVADGVVYEIFKQTRHDQVFEAVPLETKQLEDVLKKSAPCGLQTVLFSLRYLIDLNHPGSKH